MNEKLRVLIVEDEPQMVGILEFALRNDGYDTCVAYDGQQALDQFNEASPDLVLLDVMLPKIDGFEVCRRIRAVTTTPVILLTARKEDEDAIHGLELGADDYVTKPFSPKQLLMRVRAVLRRSHPSQRTIVVGALAIDMTQHRASLFDRKLDLTPTEFQLLVCLASNAGRVLSWEALLRQVWRAEEWAGGREMVKTAIYRLRQKVEANPDEPQVLLTVRGVGYTMPV